MLGKVIRDPKRFINDFVQLYPANHSKGQRNWFIKGRTGGEHEKRPQSAKAELQACVHSSKISELRRRVDRLFFGLAELLHGHFAAELDAILLVDGDHFDFHRVAHAADVGHAADVLVR